ncbi:MAG: hypothetical protein HY051_03310 [Candidatus Aenigmarchaeota archaeon]|nr:hypothetical protein [Candidatus Aenigmarchaeota archaeon]
MLSLDEIVGKIREQTGLDNAVVQQKIEDKKAELSGLISSEGAAHLVARDLNIDILARITRRLEIRNVVPGMRNVEIVARIYRIFPEREFERNGAKGKVVNMILWDPTGTVRMSMWNDETKILENLKENDVVRVFGYSKEDNRGEPELRLGGRGKIEKTNDDLPAFNNVVIEDKRSDTGEFHEGSIARVRGTLVQLFESDPFYEVCPQCGIRVRANENKFFCDEHQYVAPNYCMVLSGVVDDGVMSIRAVFFRDVAEKLIGMKTQEALSIAKERMNRTAPITERAALILGKEMVFSGRIKRNSMFDRLEFLVSGVSDVNAVEEANKILATLGN